MLEAKVSPTISVIIPTYNRAHLLGRAIQSVLEQTYRDFEIIVVDDGSTDNTEEVVKSFNDERIRYIRRERNKGGAAARNTGIKAARGEYIAFQDSDDEWSPQKLEKQMAVFKRAPLNVGVVYTGFWRIEGNKKVYIPHVMIRQKQGNIHNSLLEGCFVAASTAIVRKDCFTKVGAFDERLPCFQDWELWLRISKYYHFKCINEPLVLSYQSQDSISANKNAVKNALKLVLERHSADIKKNKKTEAKAYFSIGSHLYWVREFAEARKYFLKAARLHPLNIKFFLAAFISLFGQSVFTKAAELYRRVRI